MLLLDFAGTSDVDRGDEPSLQFTTGNNTVKCSFNTVTVSPRRSLPSTNNPTLGYFAIRVSPKVHVTTDPSEHVAYVPSDVLDDFVQQIIEAPGGEVVPWTGWDTEKDKEAYFTAQINGYLAAAKLHPEDLHSSPSCPDRLIVVVSDLQGYETVLTSAGRHVDWGRISREVAGQGTVSSIVSLCAREWGLPEDPNISIP